MVSVITALFTNNVFVSVLLAGSVSQLVKIFIFKFKYHRNKKKSKNNNPLEFDFNDWIVTGGMPSAHSALVGSLATIIWLNEGFSSLFFVVITFSLIVLRDAIGVRRSVGEEGKMIENIIKYENIKVDKFNYSLGHNPKEVLVGLLIGLIAAVLSYSLI
jgi:hypothetical protein|tara:strand:- start:5369 stop:5845 length:477 start_codon:yes stop_codon:yes gene_type:complete